MNRARIVSVIGSLLALAGLDLMPVSASAESHLMGPFVHANLGLYVVREHAAKTSASIDLETAMARGLVKFHGTSQAHTMLVDNLSDKEVFVQLGTLLKGGSQDQVIGTEVILPPRATAIPLDIFCVERGRSNAREN